MPASRAGDRANAHVSVTRALSSSEEVMRPARYHSMTVVHRAVGLGSVRMASSSCRRMMVVLSGCLLRREPFVMEPVRFDIEGQFERQGLVPGHAVPPVLVLGSPHDRNRHGAPS